MAEPVRARRLTDQEGQRLQQIVRRGKHGSVRVRRAMIIMASASGTLVPAIARLVACSGRILGRWFDLRLWRQHDRHPCLSRWYTGWW